jgi:hypothetical protein
MEGTQKASERSTGTRPVVFSRKTHKKQRSILMLESKKSLPQFTVLVPSDHDIVLKTVPSKEFFENREENQSALKVFSLDEKSAIIRQAQTEMTIAFSEKLNFIGKSMPIELLKNIAKRYMVIRKLKGRIQIEEGMIHIIDQDGIDLIVRLDHALEVLCAEPTGENKKIYDKTLKSLKKGGAKTVGKINKLKFFESEMSMKLVEKPLVVLRKKKP